VCSSDLSESPVEDQEPTAPEWIDISLSETETSHLPLTIPLDCGIAEGTEVTIEGKTSPTADYKISLHDLQDKLIFYLEYRSSTQAFILNDRDKGWGQEIALPAPSLPSSSPFEISIQAKGDPSFMVTLNGDLLSLFPVRFGSFAKVSFVEIACLKKGNCVKLKNVHLQKIPTWFVGKEEEILARPDLSSPPFLFVGIMSGPKYRSRRDSVRKTWLQDGWIKKGLVKAKFVIGFTGSEAEDQGIKEEASKEGDILLVDIKETYYNTTLKSFSILDHGSRVENAQYIMKTDDDSIVFFQRLLHFLLQCGTPLSYMGVITSIMPPVRNPKNPWYISYEDYPDMYYPPYASGAGYVLSRELALAITDPVHRKEMKNFPFEDVCVGFWVKQVRERLQVEVDYINSGLFQSTKCSDIGFDAHYVRTDQRMRCIWERYQGHQPDLCCL